MPQARGEGGYKPPLPGPQPSSLPGQGTSQEPGITHNHAQAWVSSLGEGKARYMA